MENPSIIDRAGLLPLSDRDLLYSLDTRHRTRQSERSANGALPFPISSVVLGILSLGYPYRHYDGTRR